MPGAPPAYRTSADWPPICAVHGENRPRQVAGADNRAVDSTRREFSGAGRPERDHRIGRCRVLRRIGATILIQHDGLTCAGGISGKDADGSGRHRQGKQRRRLTLVLHLDLRGAGNHTERHDGVDLAGAGENHGTSHTIKQYLGIGDGSGDGSGVIQLESSRSGRTETGAEDGDQFTGRDGILRIACRMCHGGDGGSYAIAGRRLRTSRRP